MSKIIVPWLSADIPPNDSRTVIVYNGNYIDFGYYHRDWDFAVNKFKEPGHWRNCKTVQPVECPIKKWAESLETPEEG